MDQRQRRHRHAGRNRGKPLAGGLGSLQFGSFDVPFLRDQCDRRAWHGLFDRLGDKPECPSLFLFRKRPLCVGEGAGDIGQRHRCGRDRREYFMGHRRQSDRRRRPAIAASRNAE